MKNGWLTKKLGDVCDFEGGAQPPKSQFVFGKKPGYVRFLQIRDFGSDKNITFIPESNKNRLCQETDILIGRYGASVGKILTNKAGAYNVALMKTKPNLDLFDRSWFYHYLISDEFQGRLLNIASRSAQDGFSKDDIFNFPVPVPPLPEQQRIVGILDEAFEGIASTKANAEKNLQNARALFESYLQSLFALQEHTPSVSIGDVADVFDGPHATPRTVDSGPIFLGISSLQDGAINLGETRHVTPDDYRQWTRRVKPQTDDVVFSYETRLGQAAIIPEGLECCLGRRMGLVRVNRKRVDPRYFVYQYISPSFRAFLDSKTVRGATVDRIALKEFPSFPIKLPTLDDQTRIADRIEQFRGETLRLESIYRQKLDALEALKKTLLHQAFSGRL